MSHSEVLAEIVQGFSVIEINNQSFFFKHPSIADRLIVSQFEKDLNIRARQIGLKTKEENIKCAILAGYWSDELEKEVEVLKWSIDKKKNSIKTLSEPSLKNSLEDSIRRDSDELFALEERRRRLQGISVEDYVSVKLPFFLCSQEVYQDPKFEHKTSELDVKSLVEPYIRKNADLTNRNTLLGAVYSPNFFDLFFIYDSLDKIFDKNIYQLSIFQRELMGYGKVLHSKLTKIMNIPEAVKNDPLRLYFYEEKDGKKEEIPTNIRKFAESIDGGIENIKPEDKIT